MAALQSSVLSCFLVSIILSSVAAFTPITPNLKRHKYIHPHTFVENKGKAIILFSSDQDLLVNEREMSQSKSNDVGKFVEYLGKSTSSFVSLSFFSVLAWKRDAFMFTFFAGAIGNAILSKVLKRILDQSRPEALASEESLREKPTDPGMPSSHAMSLGFIGTFTSLNIPQLWIPISLYIFVALYYRVKINLHSIEQVLVGIIIGCKFTYHTLIILSTLKT